MLAAVAIVASAGSLHAATNSFAVVNSASSAYVVNGASNPTLRLVRGFSYTFNLNASGHPFWIKTISGIGTANAYHDGVTGNGTSVGVIQFAVPTHAPSSLFYNCEFHGAMTGMLTIEDAPVIRIIATSIATNMVLKSTGTDALNLTVDSRSNLVSGTWMPVPVLSNVYSGGLNTTRIEWPTSSVAFVRISQGFQ